MPRTKSIKRTITVAVSLSVAAAALVSCSSSGGNQTKDQSGSKALKVAFIYDGSATDGNFTQQADNGRKALQKQFGSKIETTYVDNVAQSPSATQAVQSLIQKGNKLIVLNSAGYETYIKPLAQKYPDVQFEEFESAVAEGNYGAYNNNIADADYLAGMALAGASKTGRLGMVTSFPFPGIITQINGLLLGAQAIKPDATLKVSFVSSFYAPAKESQAAQALIDSGVDGMFNNQNDGNACQAAEKAGIPCVGNTILNGPSFGPNTYLTDARFIWDPIFARVTQLVLDGKKVPTSVFMGYREGAAGLGPNGASYDKLVPKDVQDKIAAKKQAMKDGTFETYTGPIKDQSGKVRVPAGQKLDPEKVITIDWAVAGVIGNIKNK